MPEEQQMKNTGKADQPAQPHPQPEDYFERHPEQLFIIKALCLMLLIFTGKKLLGFFFWWCLSGLYLTYLILHATTTGTGIFRTLWSHISFLNIPGSADKDRNSSFPWVTTALIASNSFIFLFMQTDDMSQFIDNNLVWMPRDPTWFTFYLSVVTATFLHGSFSHLFLNMLFLWVFGSVVERRIGHGLFTELYLLSGIASHIIAMAVFLMFIDEPLHSLGASGAISGVMGIYMVRCYFRNVTFPVPLFGFLPIGLNIRMNAFAAIGLYLASDVSGGINQIAGSLSRTNYWAHIGGMLAGILLAYRYSMQRQAIEERYRDMGVSVIENGVIHAEASQEVGGFNGAEKALKKSLEIMPDNIESLTHLARIQSHFSATPEGDTHYRKAILLIFKQSPGEAASLFTEYFKKYRRLMPPEEQYRLSAQLYRSGNLDLAARTLELLAAVPEASSALKENSLFQAARILDEMDLPDAARHIRKMLLHQFPNSDAAFKVQGMVRDINPSHISSGPDTRARLYLL